MQLHRASHDIERQSADLVIIGNGSAHFIAGFRDRAGYLGTIYTDPSRRTYRALDLRHGVRTSFNLKSTRRAVTALASGFRQVGTQGDPWQQGGVFVVDTAGEIVYRYRSDSAGDHPDVREIVVAAGRAAAQSKGQQSKGQQGKGDRAVTT